MEVKSGNREDFVGSPAEAAAAWDARLRAPDCTDNDRAKFAAWRAADPVHEDAFELLQTIVASLDHDRGRADVRSLRADAQRVVRARQNRRLVWWRALAASLVSVGICTALWNTRIGARLGAPILELASRLEGAEILSTGLGQRSTFVLEDGSSVELNAESRIKLAFTRLRRDVELVQGQAWFSVAKNPRRPFVVRAGNREITAVGTQFDVRLDSHTVQVTLIEGKVRVQRSGSAGSALQEQTGLAQPPADASSGTAQIVTLTPGKQLIAKITGPELTRRGPAAARSAAGATPAESSALDELETNDGQGDNAVRDIDVAKVVGWRDGRVFVEDLSLADAVDEMNKHSIVQIRVNDESLRRIRVNGMFRAGEQEAFVAALQVYLPVSAEHRGDHEIVLTSRH